MSPEPQLHPIAVVPIDTRESLAFVSYTDGRSGMDMVTRNVCPPSPRGKELRRLREQREPFMSMGEAARACGVSVVQWSGLETGSFTLTDDEWTAVLAWVQS